MKKALRFLPVMLVLVIGFSSSTGCSSYDSNVDESRIGNPHGVVSNSEYASRRQALMHEIEGGVAVIRGATTPVSDWQFLQNNDFYYLTGVEIPNSFLVIDAVNRECALFFTIEERDAAGEGIPLDLVRSPVEATGIEMHFPSERLATYLADLSSQTSTFYTSFKPEELARDNSNEKFNALRNTMTRNEWDGRLTRDLQFVERLKEKFPGVTVSDCSSLIWDLRKIKSPAEIELIRRAGQIGVEAHIALIQSTAPNTTEKELAALFEYVCNRAGAQELAYYTILMSGNNHPYGHYHRYDRILEDGDFVILDAGPDYGYYNADISTSFPANGKFSPRQKELYQLAYDIRQVCLDNYRPGITFGDVGRKVEEFLAGSGFDPSEQRFRGLVRYGGYNHSIGMATHDVMGSFDGPDEVLEPGFVFACDINMPYDEEFGLRLEDTVVITEDGCENLSPGLPRTVAEIEALMKKPGIVQQLRK